MDSCPFAIGTLVISSDLIDLRTFCKGELPRISYDLNEFSGILQGVPRISLNFKCVRYILQGVSFRFSYNANEFQYV